MTLLHLSRGRLLFLAGAIVTITRQPVAAGAQSAADSADTRGLPLIEVPATPSGGGTIALFLSGDGGWAGIDKQMARTFADGGVAVVGVNLKSYLGTRRTPEAVAADMSRVLRRYLTLWGGKRLIVVGYSRGADIAPFIVNRLPEDLKSRVDLVAMLGLGEHAGFYVNLFSLLHTATKSSDPPVRPELELLRQAGIRMLCIYGTQEKESLCRDAQEGLMTRVAKNGAHHFDGDHPALATQILAQLFAPE